MENSTITTDFGLRVKPTSFNVTARRVEVQPAMQITENRRDGVLVVVPSGRIDSSSSPEFGRIMHAIIDRGDVNIVIDMASLEYISSTGLSVFLSSAKKIRAAGGRMALSGLNSRIRLAFEMSGFLRLFPVFPSVDAAMAG